MIIIAPLSKVTSLATEHKVSHALSLLAPGTEFPELGLGANHLRMEFHDITDDREGHVPPGRAHMEEILRFAAQWPKRDPLLIHCWAGVSRSTASAYASMCLLHPDHDEQALALELRAASPEATPNLRLIKHADDILGRKGRMVKAIEALGRGAEAFEGSVVRWELK
jgi:predicted protein tyrosine phosphatase